MNRDRASTVAGLALVMVALLSAVGLVSVLIVDDSDDRSATFVTSLFLAPTGVVAVCALVGAYVIAAKPDRIALDQIGLAGAALAGLFVTAWGAATALSSLIVDDGYGTFEGGDRFTALVISAALVVAGLAAMAIGALGSGLRLSGLNTASSSTTPTPPQGAQPPYYPPPQPPAG